MKIKRECGGKILHDYEQPVNTFLQTFSIYFSYPLSRNLFKKTIRQTPGIPVPRIASALCE